MILILLSGMREKRVNYINIVVIGIDINVLTNPISRCSEDVVKDFEKIPYKKLFFSVVDYSYNYVAYLPSFKDEGCCPEATKPSINKIGKYIVEEDGFDLDKFICSN